MGDETEQKKERKTYDTGSIVEVSGMYICVPCGMKMQLDKGEIFPQCSECMKSKKYEGDNYFQELGLWELQEG